MADDNDETIVNNPDEDLTVVNDDDETRIVVRDTNRVLQVGEIIRERFVVEMMLGEGGMGQVFLAVDRQAEKSNPYVALKLLGGDFKEHPQAFAALRREAMQSRRLTHPNIVAVYDFDRTEHHVYMVMEYLKGNSLDTFIANNPQGASLETVWPLIKGCGEGLDYVHKQQIVHADFKPSNVFLTENGEVKVLDLGIARTLDESQAASSGTTRFDPDALGALTPQYASCEMFEGLSPSPQDDLYALACVAYELLTGKHPYDRKAAVEARAKALEPERPPGLKSRQWKTLKAGLAMGRSDRPETVQAFLDGLSPERKSGSPLPWIALTAVVLIAAGIQAFLQLRVDDDELIGAIMEQYPIELDEVAAAERMKLYQDMAAQFMTLGQRAIAEGQYDRASGLLLKGPSSAFKSYREILTRSDDTTTRWNAAAGVLELVRVLDNAGAEMSLAGVGVAERAEVVCAALKVAREPTLQERFAALLDESREAVLEVGDCRDLIDSGRLET